MYRRITKSKAIPVLITALALCAGGLIAPAAAKAAAIKLAVVDLGKLTAQLTEQSADQQIM